MVPKPTPEAASAGTPAAGAVKAAPSPKLWETVQIICSDGTVPASAEVLAIASPLLEKTIQAKLQKAGGAGKPLELEMRDTNTREWEVLLRQLYYEPSTPETGLDAIFTIMPLANKMGMRKLLNFLDAMAADKLPSRLAELTRNALASQAHRSVRDCLIQWVTAAGMYGLPKVKEVCVCRLKSLVHALA